MNADETIIVKIQKLLARASDTSGSSENEREIAMRMASSLAAKHSIDLGDIEAMSDAQKDTDLGRAGRGDFQRQTKSKWEAHVWNSIALLYNSKCVDTSRSNPGHICIIGRETNIFVTKYIANYCIASIRIEAKMQGYGRGTAFHDGAASAIYQTVKAIRAAQSEGIVDGIKVSDSHALVLRNNNQLQLQESKSLMATIFPRLSTSRQSADTSRNGYVAGRTYGSSLSVNQQVSHKSSARALPSH